MKLQRILASTLVLSTLSCGLMAATTSAAKNTTTSDVFAHHQKPLLSDGVAQWPSRIKLGNTLGNVGRKISIKGFLSAGVSDADSDGRYGIPNFGTVTKNAEFGANSLAGVQFNATINPKLSAVIQLVANGSDRNGNTPYRIQAEWAFVRYALSDRLQVRAGRFRIPAFMYSDTAEVGYSYPWVWLPNELYRIVPFNNFNAVELNYTQPVGNSGWKVNLQPFFGGNQSKFDVFQDNFELVPNNPSTGVGQTKATLKFDEDNIVGGVATVSNQMITLRATYIHINATAFLDSYSANLVPYIMGAFANGSISSFGSGNLPGKKNNSAYFYSFGGRLDTKRILLIGEYAKRRAFPGVASLEGYYGTLGYHLGKWLPNITYAHLRTTDLGDLAKQPSKPNPFLESAQGQQSYNIGLDYYVNANLVLKGGVYRIDHLQGNGLFDYNPGKKHVYLYALSLSAIF